MSFWHNTTHRFLFNHLPKNAGSTIRGHHAQGDGLFPADQWEGPVHSPAAIPPHWPTHRLFYIVRDPLTRFVSAWKYLAPEKTVPQLLAIATAANLHPSNYKNCPACNLKHHLLPQSSPHHGIQALGGEQLAFEDLNAELHYLFEAWELPTADLETLPHLNSTPHRGIDEIPDQNLPAVLSFLADDYRILPQYPLPKPSSLPSL